jgi:hypothetical protein
MSNLGEGDGDGKGGGCGWAHGASMSPMNWLGRHGMSIGVRPSWGWAQGAGEGVMIGGLGRGAFARWNEYEDDIELNGSAGAGADARWATGCGKGWGTGEGTGRGGSLGWDASWAAIWEA